MRVFIVTSIKDEQKYILKQHSMEDMLDYQKEEAYNEASIMKNL